MLLFSIGHFCWRSEEPWARWSDHRHRSRRSSCCPGIGLPKYIGLQGVCWKRFALSHPSNICYLLAWTRAQVDQIGRRRKWHAGKYQRTVRKLTASKRTYRCNCLCKNRMHSWLRQLDIVFTRLRFNFFNCFPLIGTECCEEPSYLRPHWPIWWFLCEQYRQGLPIEN